MEEFEELKENLNNILGLAYEKASELQDILSDDSGIMQDIITYIECAMGNLNDADYEEIKSFQEE